MEWNASIKVRESPSGNHHHINVAMDVKKPNGAKDHICWEPLLEDSTTLKCTNCNPSKSSTATKYLDQGPSRSTCTSHENSGHRSTANPSSRYSSSDNPGSKSTARPSGNRVVVEEEPSHRSTRAPKTESRRDEESRGFSSKTERPRESATKTTSRRDEESRGFSSKTERPRESATNTHSRRDECHSSKTEGSRHESRGDHSRREDTRGDYSSRPTSSSARHSESHHSHRTRDSKTGHTRNNKTRGQSNLHGIAEEAEEDFYTVLGLNPKASEDEIKKASRRARADNHPDRLYKPGMGKSEKAEIAERASKIGQAADTLGDPKSKMLYDMKRLEM